MATTAFKDMDSVSRAAQWIKFLAPAHVIPVISYIRDHPEIPSGAIHDEIVTSCGMRASISKVMKILSLRELVEIRKSGPNRCYSLTAKGIQVLEALENMGRIDL